MTCRTIFLIQLFAAQDISSAALLLLRRAGGRCEDYERQKNETDHGATCAAGVNLSGMIDA
jgi:hypothetical protein